MTANHVITTDGAGNEWKRDDSRGFEFSLLLSGASIREGHESDGRGEENQNPHKPE
jgi:hypothetical protein